MLTMGSCNGSGTNFPRVLTLKKLALYNWCLFSAPTVDFKAHDTHGL